MIWSFALYAMVTSFHPWNATLWELYKYLYQFLSNINCRRAFPVHRDGLDYSICFTSSPISPEVATRTVSWAATSANSVLSTSRGYA